MAKKLEVKIGLTMGDPNGIGTEVLIRALQFLHPFQNWEFRKTTACKQTDPLILFVFR